MRGLWRRRGRLDNRKHGRQKQGGSSEQAQHGARRRGAGAIPCERGRMFMGGHLIGDVGGQLKRGGTGSGHVGALAGELPRYRARGDNTINRPVPARWDIEYKTRDTRKQRAMPQLAYWSLYAFVRRWQEHWRS